HCRAYSAQLQPAVAKAVKDCLDRSDARRARDAEGNPTEELSATDMYECGKSALWSICSDGIDGRVNAVKDAQGKGRCDRIVDAVRARGDARPARTILSECLAVL